MYENLRYIAVSGTITCIQYFSGNTCYAVPLDPANTDYQNIMRLVESNEITIADPE